MLSSFSPNCSLFATRLHPIELGLSIFSSAALSKRKGNKRCVVVVISVVVVERSYTIAEGELKLTTRSEMVGVNVVAWHHLKSGRQSLMVFRSEFPTVMLE
jgi:hypothetical protein